MNEARIHVYVLTKSGGDARCEYRCEFTCCSAPVGGEPRDAYRRIYGGSFGDLVSRSISARGISQI